MGIQFLALITFVMACNLVGSQTGIRPSSDALFIEISKEEFVNYRTQQQAQSLEDQLQALGLSLQKDCDDICETFLLEKQNDQSIHLPSDFDSGILGLMFSTNKDKIITWSSYDGPDYHNYYEHRSEVVLYRFSDAIGIKSIEKEQIYRFKNWSIEEVIWIDDVKLGMKVYNEVKSEDDSKLNYTYVMEE